MLCGDGAGEQRRLTAAHGGSDAEMDAAPVENGIGKETQVEGEEGVSGYCGGDDGLVAPSDVIVHGLGCVEHILEVLQDIEQKSQQKLDATANRTTRQFNKTEFDDLVKRIKNGKAKVVLRKLFLFAKNCTVEQEVWIQDKSNPNAQTPTGNPYKEYTIVHVHHHDAITSGRVQDVDATKDLDFVDAINARHLAPTGHSYQGDNPFFSTFIEPSNDGASLKVYPHDWKCSVCGQKNFQKNTSCRGGGGRGCKGTPGAEYGRGNLRVDTADFKAYPLDSFTECYGGEEGRRRWATAAWCWAWKKDKSLDLGLAEILDQADKLNSGMQMLSGKGMPKINKSMTRVTGDQPGAGIVTIGMEDLMRQYGESRKKACRKCCKIQCICNAAAPETSATSSVKSEQEQPPQVEVSQNTKLQHDVKADGSPLDRPDDAPWPFTILYVGVDNGDKTDPDLNLKREFEKIEQAYRESKVYHGSSRVLIKRLLFSKWSEVLIEIRKEAPTMLQFGCHAQKGKGFELFRQIVDPHEMLDAIRSWNKSAREQSPPRPEIRIIVSNACDSEKHARVLSEVVDFAIGHRAPVADENAIDFSGIFFDCLFGCESLMDSFNQAKSCSNGYRLFSPERDPRQFYLIRSRHLSATASDNRLSSSGAATVSARDRPQDVMEGTTQRHNADADDCSEKELINFLCSEGLRKIARKLCDKLEICRREDLRRISERDIDRLELLDWQRASLSELVTSAKRAVAGVMSLTEEDLCDSDLSADETISQGASTPLARSEGSPYDTNSEDVLIASRNGGDCADFKQHMTGLIRDFFRCFNFEDVDPEWETFDWGSSWTLSMLLWIRFAHDATLEKSLRDKWLQATTNSPNQDKLLSILTECLESPGTSHPRWSPAESCERRKEHAAGISFTDEMVEYALRGNENAKQKWREDVVQDWFHTDEPFSAFLSRANKFLRDPDHSSKGMRIFESLVETQSYVVFLKMSGMAASLLLGYLEARKLDFASAAGAAGGGRTLLHGFTSFVSSEGHAFCLSKTGVPASNVVVQGLQCLVHLAHTCWEVMGPVKTAQEFLLQDDRIMELDTLVALSLKKKVDASLEGGPDDNGSAAELHDKNRKEVKNMRVREVYDDETARRVIAKYLEGVRAAWGSYVDSASGEERRIDGQAISLLLLKSKCFDGICDSDDRAVQEDLICPISRKIMRDPVKCSDGLTYERRSIEEWAKRSKTGVYHQPLEFEQGDVCKLCCQSNKEILQKIKTFQEEKRKELEDSKQSAEGEEENRILRSRLGYKWRDDDSQGRRDGGAIEEFRAVEKFLQNLLSKTGTGLACLTGPPASGKTVTMQKIVCTHAATLTPDIQMEDDGTSAVLPIPLLPLFMRAAELSKLLSETGKDAADLSEFLRDTGKENMRYLVELFLDKSARQELFSEDVKDCILQLFDNDHVLLCIDGLDEAAPYQDLVEDIIDKHVAENISDGDVRMLISTREHSYVNSRKLRRLADFDVVKLQLLDKDQQLDMIQGRLIRGEQVETFLQQLAGIADKNPELATSPFLLSLMIEVYKTDGSISSQRVELYAKQVKAIVLRCIATRTKPVALEVATDYLEILAFVCQVKRNQRDFSLAECADDVKELWKHTPDDLDLARDCLFGTNIVGLLTCVGQGVYRFSHLTLQEYLAATCAVRLFRLDAQELLNQLQPLHSPWKRMVVQFAACSMEDEEVFEGFCQLVLASDDGTGSHCELVQDFLKERGASIISEKVERMVRDKLQEIRGSERLIAGLCHPSLELRNIVLSEMKKFGVPPDPFEETDGTAAALRQIAEDGASKWHTRAAAVLSLVQMAQMDHCRKGNGRSDTLQWLLGMLTPNHSEDIRFALVAGLGTLLKGFEPTETKDEMMLVAAEDEPVLLEALKKSANGVVVEAVADLKAYSDGLMDWVSNESTLIVEGVWPMRHLLHVFCNKTATAGNQERAEKLGQQLFGRVHAVSEETFNQEQDDILKGLNMICQAMRDDRLPLFLPLLQSGEVKQRSRVMQVVAALGMQFVSKSRESLDTLAQALLSDVEACTLADLMKGESFLTALMRDESDRKHKSLREPSKVFVYQMESLGPAADQGLEAPKRVVDFLVKFEKNHLSAATEAVRIEDAQRAAAAAKTKDSGTEPSQDDVRYVKPEHIDQLEMDKWKEDNEHSEHLSIESLAAAVEDFTPRDLSTRIQQPEKPLNLFCAARLWVTSGLMRERTSEEIADWLSLSKSIAKEAEDTFTNLQGLKEPWVSGQDSKDGRWLDHVLEGMRNETPCLGRFIFTIFLGYIRERQCNMKDMSCSVIEEIEKQVKNWRPSDARVQLEQQLLLKEVRIGRRSQELPSWTGVVSETVHDPLDADIINLGVKDDNAKQRFIDFEDIKDAKINGTVSLAICFDGEKDKIQVMGEIRMWADKIKHEPQFEDIVPCDTKVKGRDGDLRLEVELQGSKKRARELKTWLKSKEFFLGSGAAGEQEAHRNRLIYTQEGQKNPVVVVEGKIGSQIDDVGIVTLFWRNDTGKEEVSGKFNSQDVAKRLSKYASEGRKPEELEMGLLEEGLAQAISGEFRPQNVADTLWAYAKMGSEPGERLLGLLEDRTETISGDFKSKHVSTTLWAYGKLWASRRMERKPGERLMGLLEGRVEATSGEFDARMLHDTLLGFANMGKKPGEGVMELLERRTEVISGNLSSQDVSKTLWAYSRMAQTFGQKPGERVMGLLEGRAETISGDFNSGDVLQTLRAYVWMRRKPGERLMGLLEGRMETISGEFDSEHVSGTLLVYARLGRMPGKGLMGLLERRMEAISGEFDSKHVSDTLEAYATMGRMPEERLMELLEERAEAISGECTSVHFVNTMSAYSRMGTMPGERLMGLLEGRMETISGKFRPQDVAQVLQAYAKMGKKPGELLMELLEGRMEAISGEFKSHHVSDTLWAYARMGRKPGERLMGLLEVRAETISGEFDSQDVSDTLWAYARMERKPGERLMELLEGRMEAISGKFDSQDVSDTLRAYAEMGSEPGERLMELLEERAEVISGEFDSQNVSDTLWAYARMGRKPGEGLMRLLEERAEAISGEFKSHHVSDTLWAYARMGRKPGEGLMGLLEERAGAISGEFDSQDVSDTLWAYARMGRMPGEGLMRLLEERAEAISGEFESHHVSRTLWAYARMGRKPGEGLMGLLERRMEAISGEFDSQNVSDTLWAYATMGRKPGEGLMRLLEERAEAISGEFESHHVSRSLWAYARMGRKPGEGLMGLLEGRMEAISGEFESHHVSETLWAYARIGRKPGERLMALLEGRMEAISEEFNSQTVSQTLEAYATMGRKPGERLMGLLEGRAEATAGVFTPLHFKNTLSAYVKMGMIPGEVLMGRLEERMETISGEFTSTQVINTLSVYETIGRKPGNRLMELLEGRMEAISGKFKSHHVSETLCAYARMGRTPGEGLMGLLEGRMETISGEFKSQDVSDTLWAYARMGSKPGEPLMGLLEGQMEAISGEFDSQDVSDTLWAYAEMGRKPGERLMELLEERAEAISGEFDSHHVSVTLVAYARMGRKPGEQLMALLEGRMEAISGEFKSHHVSDTLWAYARMGRKPGEGLMGLLEERMEAISGEFNSEGVSDTLWAYARMGTRPGERLMGQLERRAEAISGEFESYDVSRTLWAYATMKRKPGERLMGLLEERAEAISGEFDSQDVSDTLWAYAEMERMPGEQLMGLLEERAEAISGEFDSQSVTDTLRAYATMGRMPGERLMALLEGRTETISGEFKSHHVSRTLWAYATMGKNPGEGLMGLLERRAEAISGEFDSQNVSDTLWAYATMGRKPGEGLMGLLEERTEAISGEINSQAVSQTLL